MPDLKDFNLDDLRAFVAAREAEAARDAEETPAQRFVAELADHRISGPALADVFGRILAALDQLGVDVFATDGAKVREDQDVPDSAEPVSPADPFESDGPFDPPTPVEPVSPPADPPAPAKKGGK
jgi:hypothetical protein